MLTSGAARSEERSTTHNLFFFSKALLFFALLSEGYRHGKQVFEDDSDAVKFNELKHRSYFDRAKKTRSINGRDTIRWNFAV